MSRLYVYQAIAKLIHRHRTRDPFELMDAMHVQVRFYYDLTGTKGFTRYFLRQYFVGINGNLSASEQRVVAAHELGHIVLHAEALKTSMTRGAIPNTRPTCLPRICSLRTRTC